MPRSYLTGGMPGHGQFFPQSVDRAGRTTRFPKPPMLDVMYMLVRS